ncbi:MAG: hypothetical protein HYZ73_01860 [Elusimicrobia bacterium]|nr:hypothetical protein [Elusimicrobiota bacterium]
MNMTLSRWLRPTAAIMAVAVFYAQVVAPPLLQASFWEERRQTVQRLSSCEIGKLAKTIGPYATIREAHLAPSHPTPLIIHIQDLHGHWEVQRNIAKVIEVLQRETDHPLLIGVEGATGESLQDFYRVFPDKALNLDIADYFLKEGLITGAEYAGMTADPAPLLWGVEDANLYRAHVQTYRQLLPEQSKLKEMLSQLKTQLKQWKESHYPPSLKALDARMEAYHSSRLPLGQYVQFLAAQWDVTSKGPNDSHPLPYPNIAHFLQALTLEPSLDFAHVSRGQERFRQYVDLVGGLKTHTLFDELDQL